jgi:hypothetical protein
MIFFIIDDYDWQRSDWPKKLYSSPITALATSETLSGIYADSVLSLLHHVDVGNVANVLEAHAAPILYIL